MIIISKFYVLILSFIIFANVDFVFAQSKKAKISKKSKIVKSKKDNPEKIIQSYRNNSMSAVDALNKMSKIDLIAPKKLLNAYILRDKQLPILASLQASQVIQFDKSSPKQKMMAWELMYKISQEHPIQIILERIADPKTGKIVSVAPYFEGSWNYYIGMYYLNKSENAEALKYFTRLDLTDRLYLAAKYQEGLLLIQKDIPKAIKVFKSLANRTPEDVNDKIAGLERREIINYSKLAVARLNYENKNFIESIRYYRKVDRDSHRFYDALFEQAWAFFMAGYPNHSLGALYGSESSFFKDKFKPETSILASLVYYWMCRYEDARHALAEFYEKYSKPIDQLEQFLKSRELTNQKGYDLFENYILNISEKSIGIPRSILATAADSETMMYYRDLLASLLEEKKKFENLDINFIEDQKKELSDYLIRLHQISKDKLGSVYLEELQVLKQDYDRLNEQAQFLYIEMLMSEKDSVLGKELHQEKIREVIENNKAKGWGSARESWKGSTKNEFWWDEVGYYIFSLRPQCN